MRALRLVLGAIGLLAMGYAVLGALTDPGERLTGNLIFLGAVLVLHDALFLPVLLGLGLLVRRLTPAAVRPVVQGALVVSVAVALFALPLVGGFGRTADNLSILPLNYGRGLVAVLIVVWLVAAEFAYLRYAATAKASRQARADRIQADAIARADSAEPAGGR